jgi:hypothetical protein
MTPEGISADLARRHSLAVDVCGEDADGLVIGYGATTRGGLSALSSLLAELT